VEMSKRTDQHEDLIEQEGDTDAVASMLLILSEFFEGLPDDPEELLRCGWFKTSALPEAWKRNLRVPKERKCLPKLLIYRAGTQEQVATRQPAMVQEQRIAI
jgi:hypothetical protein